MTSVVRRSGIKAEAAAAVARHTTFTVDLQVHACVSVLRNLIQLSAGRKETTRVLSAAQVTRGHISRPVNKSISISFRAA